MVRSYKVTTEITVHTLSAPGTWLPNRDDVYLTIELFNQVKRTRLTDPIFPLVFHDRFTFEKVFWAASDAIDVTEMLEDLPVVIELRQVTDVYLGGALLAYFDSSARDVISPYPSTTPRLEKGRELIMCRTVDFTGISPKMEFTTYTIIEEFPTGYLDSVEDPYLSEPVRPPRRPRSLKRSPSPMLNGSYERQTVSSALRTRSPSPTDRISLASAPLSRKKKRPPAPVEMRPPFVVRKVDTNMLLRKPKLHDNYRDLLMAKHKKSQKNRCRSVSPSRLMNGGGNFGDVEEEYVIPRLSCEVCNLTNEADLNLRDFDNIPPEPPKFKTIPGHSSQQFDDSRRRQVNFSDPETDDDMEVTYINQQSDSPMTYYPSLQTRYSPSMENLSKRISNRVYESDRLNASPMVY